MAVIDLRNFGGEMPSTSARALPANAAQTNQNLLLAINEFRPLAEDTNTGTAAVNAKTIYRMGSGTWRVSTSDLNHVRGQINDDATERTYLTFNDGSARPRVINSSGADRVLGVPAPSTAPTLVRNVVDELRVSELPEAQTRAVSLIESTLRAQVQQKLLGGITFSAPSSSSYGWIDHATDTSQKYLMVPMSAGAVSPGLEFVLDPRLNGAQVSYSGGTYWRVPTKIFARGWSFNESALATALAAIDDPAIAEEKLLTTDEANFIADEAHRYLDDTVEPQKGLIAAMVAKTAALDGILSKAQSATLQAAFFSSDAYTRPLWALTGSSMTGADGTVTVRLMDILYILVANTAWGLADNVNAGDDAAAWVTNYATQGTPLGWWEPNIPAGSFSRSEGQGKVRTALFAAIKTGADGVRYLDYDEIRAKVMGEVNDLVSRRPTAESRNYYAALVEGWVTEALAPLRAFLERENLRRLELGLVGSDTASAFVSAVNDIQFAVDDVERLYGTLNTFLSVQAVKAIEHHSVGVVARQAGEAVVPIIDLRYYIYTYVTDWGEESAPSPVSASIELDQNDTVSVTLSAPPSGRNVTKWRLYRSNTGSSSTAFQFVAEAEVSSLTYTDELKGGDLGEVCPSLSWLEPSANLRGLVGMPNGIMAGFFENTVAFCEPFIPYAWPAEYWVPLEFPVVGLGVFGQTLFVGTTGNPYFISGADSASMSAIKLDSPQSCASRRSIATVQGGVLYASPDGLCVATPNGVEIISTGLFTREDWQKLTPSTMFAAQHEGIYYLFYAGSGGGCLMFDLASKKLGGIALTATAAHNDLLTDTLYVARSGTIHSIATAATKRAGKFKTGLMTMQRQEPLAWLQVYGEQSAETPVTIKWYGDGALRHTAVVTGAAPVRLPPGRWLEHEIEVESAARVTRVVLAGSTQELQSQ